MKKKLVCLVIVLAMLFAPVGLFHARGQDAAVSALLDQLSAFLDAEEQIRGWLADCCLQTGTFYTRRDYPSLVRARLACSSTLDLLRNCPAPEMALDEDALLVLAQMKIEIIALDDKAQEIRNLLEDGIRRIATEELFLHSYPVYLEESLAAGEIVNRSMGDRLFVGAEYTGCWLNGLLLPVADRPETLAFRNSIPDRWPLIARHMQPWTGDAGEIAAACAAIVRDLENLTDEMAVAEGRNAYAMERYARDPEALAADFRWLEGSPSDVLPLPGFWRESETKTLTADAGFTGEEALPEVLTWRIPGISSEQYTDYLNQLEERGFPVVRSGNVQDGLKAVTGSPDNPARVYWMGGTVYIAYYPDRLTFEIR